MSKNSLPKWLEQILPADKPYSVVSVKEDKLLLTHPDNSEEYFDGLEALGHAVNNIDFSVKDEVIEKFSETKLMRLFYKLPNGYYGAIIEQNDAKRRKQLANAYEASLKYIKAFRDVPSFKTAWRMLDTHPVFWLAHDFEKHPFSWKTSGACSSLEINLIIPDKPQEDDILFMTTGGHVPDEIEGKPYSTRYSDWRLEVFARTYEEGIIELAKRVLVCFNDDGSDKPEKEVENVLKKPEWLVELERRIKDD